MKKILVLTDLSPNSSAGVHFAIQLALRTDGALIFYHFVELPKPARWSKATYSNYLERELGKHTNALQKHVEMGFSKIKGVKPKYRCVVRHGSDITSSTIAYASRIRANAICISTRGAGAFKKLIGTTASRILEKSKIPVFVVPNTYQDIPSKHIFYASDLTNFKAEFKKVEKLAAIANARISIYHYDYFPNLVSKLKEIKRTAKSLSGLAKFRIRELNPNVSLSKQLLEDMTNAKASLVVLFTDHNKSWFKQIFLPGNSKEVSFQTKIPLLVIEK
jgi:nucleotide-binding universal stress UspA family protein